MTVGADDQVSAAALRKRKERAGKKAAGMVSREFDQTWYQAGMADFMCRVRAGHDVPYEFVEYVDTLIRQDYARFQAQWAEVNASHCDNCRKALPLGCAGRLSMESACWHSQGIKLLQL